MISYYAITKKGDRRDLNEDRIMVQNTIISDGHIKGKSARRLLTVVCDGVGGNKRGDIAAEIVASGWTEKNLANCSLHDIKEQLYLLNQKVIEEQKNNYDYANMATTVSGLIITDEQYIFFNVGDTRIYMINEQGIERISSEQSLINDELVLLGYPETIYPQLTSYIGGNGKSCDPFIGSKKIKESVYFLLCSDGIYKKVFEKDLCNIISSEKDMGEKVEEILDLSILNGSHDDKSLVLVKYEIE